MENNIQQTDQSHSVSSTTSYHPSTTFIILMVVLLTITVGLGGYILGAKQNRIVKNQTTPVTSITQPSPTPVDETANWKIYRNEEFGFEMKYPDFVEFQKKENGFSLKHSVEFLHGNPCDFIGDGSIPPLKQLTDFSMNVETISGGFEKTIEKHETSFLTKDYLQGNTLKEERGFIDRIKAGELEGYKITSGVEGCGTRTYYLFIENENILRIQIPLELDIIYPSATLKEAKAFSSEEVKYLYSQILSTFQFSN